MTGNEVRERLNPLLEQIPDKTFRKQLGKLIFELRDDRVIQIQKETVVKYPDDIDEQRKALEQKEAFLKKETERYNAMRAEVVKRQEDLLRQTSEWRKEQDERDRYKKRGLEGLNIQVISCHWHNESPKGCAFRLCKKNQTFNHLFKTLCKCEDIWLAEHNKGAMAKSFELDLWELAPHCKGNKSANGAENELLMIAKVYLLEKYGYLESNEHNGVVFLMMP